MSTKPGYEDFNELFDRYGPLVYRRARNILGNEADAREATQEVFLRAMANYEKFGGNSKVTTWLYAITTNYCLAQIRDTTRRRELLSENAERVEPQQPGRCSPIDMMLLRDLILEADEKQATAAMYVYMDGLSHHRTAELMGISRRSVGNLTARFLTWARKRASR